MDKYFAITQIDKINFKDPKSHISECETLTEAQNFPLTDIIVIKKELGAQRIDSGFIYPYVFNYKVIDKDENPYLLSYKSNKTTNFIFETLRSGYSSDKGSSEVPILDNNNICRTIMISAQYNISAIFIINIIEFLFLFENDYASNWNFYDKINSQNEILQNLEKENVLLNEKVEEMSLKIKALDLKLKEIKKRKVIVKKI